MCMEVDSISPIKDCNQKIVAIHDTMDVLNGKWKVSIVACLGYRPMRFSELLKEVTGIAGKVLSQGTERHGSQPVDFKSSGEHPACCDAV